MKNLLLYINPSKRFDDETRNLVKIQIENSLDLGWKPEDILLVTNFPYEFMGIKAHLVPDSCFNTIHKQATKVDTMVYLFETGFIKDELYWLHDFDACQNYWISEEELELEGFEIGLTDYGREPKWNGGSTFLRRSTYDLYVEMRDGMYRENKIILKKPKNEEDILMLMFEKNFNNIEGRAKRLNISYNFGIKRMELCYKKAIKPLKVLHFHPERVYQGWGRAFDILTTNNNELGHSIMSERLQTIFNKYGYRASK